MVRWIPIMLVPFCIGCFQMTERQGLVSEQNSSSENRQENQLDNPAAQLGNLHYINKVQINSILRNQLMIRNPNSITGQFENLEGGTPNPLTSKEATQIFIIACEQAFNRGNPNRNSVMQLLFPNGENDFRTIYQTFIGREPTASEVQILEELRSRVRNANKAAAVCSAAASNIAALSNS